jgi:hypothetical protein
VNPTSATPAASRRRFIRLAGGGAVLAAASPALLSACAGGMPDAALAPWAEPVDALDTRHFMLAHALLAPNPHNRQPWLADLGRPGEISLRCDGDRLLPQTDPFGRQILIGCGAFVELAVLAAAQRGRAVRVIGFPDGEPPADALPRGTVVARLLLGEPGSAEPDPLFALIRERRTHKGAYDSQRPLPAPVWQRLQAAAGAVAAQAPLQLGQVQAPAGLVALRHLTRVAFEVESLTPATYLESARLMRIGPREIEAHRDGISLTGTMPRLLSAVGLFDRFEVPTRGSDAHRRMAAYWKPMETGSGFFWMATRGNRRPDQLAVGRAFVRSQLQATADGVAMHPLSQALQEFPAMREARQAAHAALGLDPAVHTLQMLCRVGFALEAAGHSPRRPLSALLPV